MDDRIWLQFELAGWQRLRKSCSMTRRVGNLQIHHRFKEAERAASAHWRD